MRQQSDELPALLNAATALSIIAGITGTFFYLLIAIFYKYTREWLIMATNSQSLNQLSASYFFAIGCAFIISLTGALKIRKCHFSGYLLYCISQLLILFIPVFKLGGQGLSAMNVIFTICFISVYSYYYPIYKKRRTQRSASLF